MDSFNKSGTGPSVMLLSLTAGGVGLVCQKVLIPLNFLEFDWRKPPFHGGFALESSIGAASMRPNLPTWPEEERLHPQVQKGPKIKLNSLFIRFICNETIEQRVLEIQDRKSKMATGVMEGAASKRLTKLSKDELVYLFELDKRPQVPRVPAIQQPADVQAVSK